MSFDRIFTLDEMFAFSDEGIHILTRKIAPEAAETKSETEEYSIWLANEE